MWYQPVRGRCPAPDGREDPQPRLHHFFKIPPVEYDPLPAQRDLHKENGESPVSPVLTDKFNELTIPAQSDDGIDVVDLAEPYTPEYYWVSDHQLPDEPEPFLLTLVRQQLPSPWEERSGTTFGTQQPKQLTGQTTIGTNPTRRQH